MRSSHRIVTLHFGIALFLSLALIVLGLGNSALAQQPAANPSEDRDRGIQLYKQGDTRGAIEALHAAVKHNKDDISAWHYLGLALEKNGDGGSARTAHEKAAKLGDNLLDSRLNETNGDKKIGSTLLTIRSQLVQAAEMPIDTWR